MIGRIILKYFNKLIEVKENSVGEKIFIVFFV